MACIRYTLIVIY